MFGFRITVSCILVICVFSKVVKTSDGTDKDMKNVTINTEQYCKNKICIYKCCGENEILNVNKICEPKKKFVKLVKKVKYKSIVITQSLNGNNVTKSKKRLTEDFVFINNDKFRTDKKYEIINDDFRIWENGTVTIFEGQSERTDILQPLTYCVDYRVNLTFNEKNKIIDRHLFFVLQILGENLGFDTYFISIGMLISCCFCLLTLLIYGLLPQLRKINGMMLMAYVSTLCITYFCRAALPFAMYCFDKLDCKKFTPVYYFAVLTNFFWLNVLSFDLFWTFTGNRMFRTHRQGKKVKFTWYCLYAFGVPLLITIALVILDNMDIKKYGLTPPPFSECFNVGIEVQLYLQIPIAIIIGVNTLLFFITAYNIWLIKRDIRASPDSRNTKKNINNYIMNMKLAVMTGISWIIEVLQGFNNSFFDNTWSNIVLNFYHVFIGVFIFFLFVFKKKIFIMLCKKFHINNNFVRNLQLSEEYSKSRTEFKNSKGYRYTFKSSRNEGP